MDKRRIFLTALVTLGVTLTCVLLIRLPTLQNTVREGLILPVVYLVWLVRLLLHSVDQAVLWAAAMFILGLALTYGLLSAWPDAESMLRPGQRSNTVRTNSEEQQPPPVSGRIDYWEGKIQSLRSQGIESDYANFEFRRLTRSAAETIPGESSQAAAAEAIGVFFLPTDRTSGAPLKSSPAWRRLRFGRRPPPAAGDDPLAKLCTYLEDQLESKHDDVY
jgi:hypothetical protein